MWLGERLAEITVGAAASFVVFGQSTYPIENNALREVTINMLAAVFFMFISGYVISTMIMSCTKMRKKPLLYGAASMLVFLAHVIIFSVFVSEQNMMYVGVLCLLPVFLINMVGAKVVN